MARLVEVRGGTGAGKSTLVRAVMAEAPVDRITTFGDDIWLGYFGKVRVGVPGSYRMKTGGLENRYSQEEILRLLGRCAEYGTAMFEGGLISKSTGRVYEWCTAHDYHVVYLALPVEQAVRNLMRRRNKDKLSAVQIAAIERDHLTVRNAITRIAADGRARVYSLQTFESAKDLVLQLVKGK